MAMVGDDAATQRSEQTMCLCDQIAATRTAWTKNNPGRRFLGYSYYGRPDSCDYFKWVDPPLIHPRYKSVINGLLQNANREGVVEKKWQRIVLHQRIVLAMLVVLVLVQYVL
ncbi:uncharacterized protein Fot_05640 [Forsythia ovata]|uniref:GRF-type domain-containing protein n=1 Tax=Forsythia ovata TaxID=205694 RepID=A0ABD1WQZ9_9LAMI